MGLRLISTFRAHLLSVTPISLSISINDPEIMLGMLEIVFRGDAVAGCLCVSGQGQIFLQHLMGVAANPHLGSVAVEGLILHGHMRLTVAAAAGAP